MPTGLQHAIRGHVFERGAPGFEAAAHVFDPRFDHVLPDAVARPVDGADVRDAIRFCTGKGIARSGAVRWSQLRRLLDGRRTASCSTCASSTRSRSTSQAGTAHRRRRHPVDRPVRPSGAVRGHGSGWFVPVGGHRGRHPRRRLWARRSPPGADDRQPEGGQHSDGRWRAAVGR